MRRSRLHWRAYPYASIGVTESDMYEWNNRWVNDPPTYDTGGTGGTITYTANNTTCSGTGFCSNSSPPSVNRSPGWAG
jgi:hypothetical protein